MKFCEKSPYILIQLLYQSCPCLHNASPNHSNQDLSPRKNKYHIQKPGKTNRNYCCLLRGKAGKALVWEWEHYLVNSVMICCPNQIHYLPVRDCSLFFSRKQTTQNSCSNILGWTLSPDHCPAESSDNHSTAFFTSGWSLGDVMWKNQLMCLEPKISISIFLAEERGVDEHHFSDICDSFCDILTKCCLQTQNSSRNLGVLILWVQHHLGELFDTAFTPVWFLALWFYRKNIFLLIYKWMDLISAEPTNKLLSGCSSRRSSAVFWNS